VRRPARSTWYGNSLAFEGVLRTATRDYFETQMRLKHLPPVRRQTFRNKERRAMVKEARMKFARFATDCGVSQV